MKTIKSLILLATCTVVASWVGRWLGKYDSFENMVMCQFYTLFAINFFILRDVADIKDKLENFKTDYMMVDITAVKKAEEEAKDEN